MAEAIIVNVDDHEPARYARTRILRAAGFSVHEARPEAIRCDWSTTCTPIWFCLTSISRI